MARTSLMTSIFFSPIAARTTVNSVFSSAAGAAAAPAAGPAATATAAAAETPHFSSRIDREAVVRNTVPETVSDFLAQRTRVNYGHRQLSESGFQPATLDRLIWSRPRMCLRVLARAISKKPVNSVRLPLLASLELLALVRGRRDFARGVEYERWSLIRSGKGGSFPNAARDTATGVPEK